MKLRFISLLVIGFWLLVIAKVPAHAAEAKAETKVLTKGEAIMLLSASDFMKKKISDLVSWTVGYDISGLSRVTLLPTINYIRAVPKKVPPDGRTIIEIVASVDDPAGLGNISGVRADLSSIGRLSNTLLVDNGLYGDTKALDGVYTLQTSASPKVIIGQKEIPVAVANKKGWLTIAKTNLDIRKNPDIIEVRFAPDRARADGRSVVTLNVRVDNPGRVEDLERVSADLSPLGYGERILLRNDGKGGDAVAGDEIFTLQFTVPDSLKPGDYSIRVEAQNVMSGFSSKNVALEVYK